MSSADHGIVVRRTRPDEAATFKAFRLRALADAPDAFATTTAHAEAMPWEMWVHRVTRGSVGKESLLLVAVDDTTDRWLGITGSYFEDDEPQVAHVISVWVAPEARRCGVARLLQESARSWAVSRGACEQRLWVTSNNDAARALYLAEGFTLTGTTQPHPVKPDLHEQEMVRALP
jgi:GNAT superfamily N-acetyltransferase